MINFCYSRLYIRVGVETQCFETETRQDFKVARPRRDFGVPRPRRDTRLYKSCFSLCQGCGARVGSRSRMVFGGVEVVF